MSDVKIREGDVFDIPLLAHELSTKFRDWERVDFHHAQTFIAEYLGKPFASCSARLVLQIEPLMVFDDDVPRAAKTRGMHDLLKQMEAWIADPERNTTGICTYVCHLATDTVAKLAARLGMTIYNYFGTKTLTSTQ